MREGVEGSDRYKEYKGRTDSNSPTMYYYNIYLIETKY